MAKSHSPNRNDCWRSRATNIEAWVSDWDQEAQCRHAHDFVQVSRVTAGAGTVCCLGEAREVFAGQIVVLPAGAAHGLTPSGIGRWQFDTLYLPEEHFPEGLWPATGTCHWEIRAETGLVSAFDALHASIQEQDSRMEQQCLLQELVALACSSNDICDAERAAGLPVRELSSVRDLLLSDIGNDLSLPEVANSVGLSAGHLHRAFRRRFGLPPHAYLVQARVNRARRMLQAGASIVDAASTTGFADQAHLTRHFKRLVGLTPGRYVKRIRAADQERSRRS